MTIDRAALLAEFRAANAAPAPAAKYPGLLNEFRAFSAQAKPTAPGIAAELGGSLGRGVVNLGAVPYDAGAGILAFADRAITPPANPTTFEQFAMPGATAGQLQQARLSNQVTDLRSQLGNIAQARQPMNLNDLVARLQRGEITGQAFQDLMTQAQPTNPDAQRADVMSRMAATSQQLADAQQLNPLQAGALGAFQTGTAVKDAASATFPPSPAAANRAWYSPMSIANATLENAPQIAAQLAIAFATGGAGTAGQIAGFVGSGTAMELADATRSQAEGFKRQGMNELDALRAGAPAAVVTAAVNGALERLSAAGILPTEKIARDALEGRLRAAATQALKGGTAEAVTEMGQELTSASAEAASGADPTALDAARLVPRVGTAGLSSFFLGGGAGAVAGATERSAGPLPSQPQANVDQTQNQQQGVQGGQSVPDGGNPDATVVAPGVADRSAQAEPPSVVPGDVLPPADAAPVVDAVGAVPGAQAMPPVEAARAGGVDLAAVEEAGRKDAADGLEPEALPEGTDPAIVEAYTRGYGSDPSRISGSTNDAGVILGNDGLGRGDSAGDAAAGVGVRSPGRVGEAALPVASAVDAGRSAEPSGKVEELSWAERAAARLEAQAAEMTRGNTGPRGKGLSRAGSTNLPAELVAIAYRTAAKVLRGGSRTIAAIRAAVDAETKDRTPEERRLISRAVFTEIREAERQAKAATAGPEAVRDVKVAMTAREQGRAEGRSEATQTAKAQASNAAQVVKQKNERRTVAQMLEANMKGRAQGQAKGFREGVAAGKAEAAKPKPLTAKQQVAKTTGIVDDGDAKTVSQRDALAASMKAQERAATAADRAARREERAAALDRLSAKVEEMRGQAGTELENRRRIAKLVKDLAPPELTKRFLGAVASAKTDKQVDAAATRLLNAVEEYRVRRAIKEAEAVARKVDERKLLEDLQGDVKEAQKTIAGLKEELAAANKEADANLKRLAEYRTAALQQADKARAASTIQRLDTETIAELTKRTEVMARVRAGMIEAMNAIKSARHAQRIWDEVQVEGKAQARAEVVADAIDRVANVKIPDIKSKERIPTNPKSSAWRKFWTLTKNRETMSAYVGDGALGKMLTEAIWDGETAMSGGIERGNKARQKAVEAAGYEWGSRELRKLSSATSGQDADLTTINLPNAGKLEATPAELAGIYAVLTDAGARKNILKGAPIVLKRLSQVDDGLKFTRADVQAFERLIDPKLRKIVDDLKRDYRENVTEREREAFREHFGYDMPRIDGYWRTERRINRGGTEGMISAASIPKGMGKLSEMGAWKLRDEKAIRAPYIASDVFTMHEAMIREAEARINLNKPVRSLQVVLRDSNLQRTLIKKYGSSFVAELMKTADASSIILQKPELVPMAKAAQIVQRNLSRAFLQLSPSPVLKNLGGILKLPAVMKPKYVIPAIREMGSDAVYQRMLDGSAFFRQKHEHSAAIRMAEVIGDGSDVLGEPSKTDLAKDRRLGELVDRLPFFAWGDARASVVAWRAAELQVEAEHPDWSKAEKAAWVAKTAEYAIRRTQNPASVIDQSTMSRRTRGTPYSVFTQFTSDGIASMNMLMREAMRHGYKSPQFARAATAVMLNNAWAATVTATLTAAVPQLAAALAGNDDEELRKNQRNFADVFAKEFAANTGGLVYFGPQGLEQFVALGRALSGDATRPPDVSIAPAFSTIGSALSGLFYAVASGVKVLQNPDQSAREDAIESLWKHSEKMALSGSALMGVPAAPLYSLGKRVVVGATAEPDAEQSKKIALDAIKADDKEQATTALSALIAMGKDSLLNRSRQVARMLHDQGPRGTANDEEWRRRLNGLDADKRAALVKAQRDWETKVNAAVRVAAPKAAERRKRDQTPPK